MKNIVIVGGGANGTAAFIELVIQIVTLKLKDEVEITIIEREKKIGLGLAFGTNQKSHLLNTQANLMGIYAHEPAHFSEWLENQGGKNRQDVKGESDVSSSYTSRILYGNYVANQFDKTVEKAKRNGLKVNYVYDEAVSMKSMDEGRFCIQLKSTKKIDADYLIVAAGTPKPTLFKELRVHEAYIDFPWPSSRLHKKINKNDHVGILGTSLSAIDTIMTLMENHHEGKITLFSPDGMMPRVQPDENIELERKHLTLDKIHKTKRELLKRPQVKELFRLFMKDAEEAENNEIDWKGLNRYAQSAEELLDYDIQKAEEGGDTLLNLAYSLRYDTSILWNWLEIDQKELFAKWLGRHWAVNRHAMPIHNAKKIRNLFKDGKLQVIPQNTEIKYSDNIEKFIINTAGDGAFEVDKLVNATGSPTHLKDMDNEFIQNLVENEYLSPYPLGGAVVNPINLRSISKNAGGNIYAVGHLANGILMDVNAVWFNVRTIANLTEQIIFKLKEDGNIY